MRLKSATAFSTVSEYETGKITEREDPGVRRSTSQETCLYQLGNLGRKDVLNIHDSIY